MIYPEPQRRWTPPSFKTRLLVYLFFFSLVSSLLFLRGCRVAVQQDWDVLIFTQSWPNTVCMAWEEKNPTNNSCRLPIEKDTWTIHGIWPTKLGTLGPCFCNSSNHFNVSELAPIQSNLSQYWIDVEIPQPNNSFWKHEWDKHGTCSQVIPSLDSELKYFEQGLEWLQQYNMKGILEKEGVLPKMDAGWDVTDFWLAVKRTLGVNPFLHCIHDKKTKEYYIREIRICFDKSMKLTDCDGVKSREQFQWKPLGDCPTDKPVFYPSIVPPTYRKPVPPPPDTYFISLLKLVRFFMWFTA